jgi:hypothetical protein
MTRPLRAALVGGLALSAAGARVALGQATAPLLGAVSGYVVDPGGRPVPGARVLVRGTPRLAVTGREGEYRIDSVPAGERLIRVRADGFAPLDLTLAVPSADIADLDVRLDSAPPAADTLAPPDAPDLPRRAAARPDFVIFVLRPELDRHPERTLTQYLRTHAWVAVHDGSVWSVPTASSHATANAVATISMDEFYRRRGALGEMGTIVGRRDECGHAWPVLLDGVPLEPPYRLDDIPVSAVSALEVRLPLAHVFEDPHLANSPACGLVFVYTR